MKLRKMICCAICVLSIFTLISCAAQPPSNDGETIVQSTEDTTPNTDSTDIVFNWESKFVQTWLLDHTYYDHIGEKKIQRLTYESCKSLVDNALIEHGVCDAWECELSVGETECKTVRYLKGISYPEEFFRENTLLLIPYSWPVDSVFFMKDITYEANTLTCIGEYVLYAEDSGLSTGAHRSCSIFIEIDTVLPEEIQLKYETTHLTLDLEAYKQKQDAFNKLINATP